MGPSRKFWAAVSLFPLFSCETGCDGSWQTCEHFTGRPKRIRNLLNHHLHKLNLEKFVFNSIPYKFAFDLVVELSQPVAWLFATRVFRQPVLQMAPGRLQTHLAKTPAFANRLAEVHLGPGNGGILAIYFWEDNQPLVFECYVFGVPYTVHII